MRHVKHASFKGRLVMLGFGSIGKAALPLIFRHIDMPPERVKIISRSADKSGIAQEFGADFVAQPLDEQNFESVLDAHLSEGDFLLNLSVDVSSLALMMFCWRRGVMYLDTCIEPWPGRYADPGCPLSRRTNYALREDVLAFRIDKRTGPTAVVTQGANPGLASAFVKQALREMAAGCRA
jgi:homospermidine synthase